MLFEVFFLLAHAINVDNSIPRKIALSRSNATDMIHLHSVVSQQFSCVSDCLCMYPVQVKDVCVHNQWGAITKAITLV